jgi:hypothetical protein
MPAGRLPLSRTDQALFAATVNHHLRMHGRRVEATNDTRPSVLVDILYGKVHDSSISDQLECVPEIVANGPPVPWVHLWPRIFAARVTHPFGDGPLTIEFRTASVRQATRTFALSACWLLTLAGVLVEVRSIRVRDATPWGHTILAVLVVLALCILLATAPVNVRLELGEREWKLTKTRLWLFSTSCHGLKQQLKECKVCVRAWHTILAVLLVLALRYPSGHRACRRVA